MDAKNIKGAKVTHSKYGEGIVISLKDCYLEVEFSNKIKKQFRYPDAFSQYLNMDDELLKEQISLELDEKMSNNGVIDYAHSKENYERFRSFVREKEKKQRRNEILQAEKQRQSRIMREERMKKFQNNS